MSFVARIYVTPRKDVLDPQGSAVGHALHSLGYEEVHEVHIGRYLVLEMDGADQATVLGRVGAMCERLLANPVVEDYRIEVEEVSDPSHAEERPAR